MSSELVYIEGPSLDIAPFIREIEDALAKRDVKKHVYEEGAYEKGVYEDKAKEYYQVWSVGMKDDKESGKFAIEIDLGCFVNGDGFKEVYDTSPDGSFLEGMEPMNDEKLAECFPREKKMPLCASCIFIPPEPS